MLRPTDPLSNKMIMGRCREGEIHPSPKMVKWKWTFSVMVGALLCVLCFLSYLNMEIVSSRYSIHSIFPFLPLTETLNQKAPFTYVESRLSNTPPTADDTLPTLAYFLSGSTGDLESMWRTLRAIYHPRNQYVIHMDRKSPVTERMELARRVKRDPVFSKMGNVHIIVKANMVTYRGPTMIANTLHACAILLKRSKKWDWFINLSASDYPLITQDGESNRSSLPLYTVNCMYVCIYQSIYLSLVIYFFLARTHRGNMISHADYRHAAHILDIAERSKLRGAYESSWLESVSLSDPSSHLVFFFSFLLISAAISQREGGREPSR